MKFSPISLDVVAALQKKEDDALAVSVVETIGALPVVVLFVVIKSTTDIGRCTGTLARAKDFVNEMYSEFSIHVSHR
tara:strand:- start:51 stop:281 length:231 start_codon:yes stop_codon:yes gene_type:complete